MPCRFYNFEFGWKFLLLFVNFKILEWELVWGLEISPIEEEMMNIELCMG